MNYVHSDLRREAVAEPWHGTPSPQVPDKPGKWRRWLLGLGMLFVLAAGLAFGAWRSYSQNLQAVATTHQRQDFVPTMRVQAVRASGEYVAVTLPATTAAFSVANIFARASGYIDKRNVDIGDHVKEGQLLVQIVAPELDHQIAQAKATLAQLEATVQQTQANKELARVTWGRDSPLVDKGWVTPQQGTIDVQTLKAQEAAVGVAEANVAAQRAQILVLNQQKAYQRVLRIPRKTPSLLVPADAIIFNADGLQVAVADDGVVHIRKISVARDLGKEIEVRDGVKQGDQVILNPPVDLTDGKKVQIRSSDPKA